MGSYSVIAEVGTQLVNCLVRGLVPELVQDPNGIGLRHPADKGDVSLGLFLYDIRESSEIRESGMINAGLDTRRFPPVYLSLYYMITAYSGSDVKFRSLQEQRMLGRTMQVFHDDPLLSADYGGTAQPQLHVQLLDLSIEEKLQIWGNNNGTPYRTSLFYRVSPVALESAKTKRISRVADIDVRLLEPERE